MENYRQTYSWQGAVAFSAPLMRLCEELPASEQFGLVVQIQRMAVELPASIAMDLARGTEVRFDALMRIEAALAVIDRIYPALDATSLMDYIDSLRIQLAGDRLHETNQPEQPYAVVDEVVVNAEADLDASDENADDDEAVSHIEIDVSDNV